MDREAIVELVEQQEKARDELSRLLDRLKNTDSRIANHLFNTAFASDVLRDSTDVTRATTTRLREILRAPPEDEEGAVLRLVYELRKEAGEGL